MINFISKYIYSEKLKPLGKTLIFIFVAVFCFSLVYFYQSVYFLQKDMASSTTAFAEKINSINLALNNLEKDNEDLSYRLLSEQDKSVIFEQQISGISSTVGTLQKLSKTDRELLQKYSRVYFLNENYVPERLANIDTKYLYDKTKNLQFHALVLQYLTKMLDDSNMGLQVVSAYRSFGNQATLKTDYLVSYGAGANKFSADQGYSEHQLGTTVDLSISDSSIFLKTTFDKTDAFSWLKNNAYKYGFVLSYPQGNSYYQYEPWHWRFVGVKLATRLHDDNMNFYDLNQRDIDRYLVYIFD